MHIPDGLRNFPQYRFRNIAGSNAHTSQRFRRVEIDNIREILALKSAVGRQSAPFEKHEIHAVRDQSAVFFPDVFLVKRLQITAFQHVGKLSEIVGKIVLHGGFCGIGECVVQIFPPRAAEPVGKPFDDGRRITVAHLPDGNRHSAAVGRLRVGHVKIIFQLGLVVVGGGVIGVEFATFYAELGCEVTVIEGMDRLLPTMDRELGQNLALILKKQGVRVCTASMVKNVERAEGGLTVNFTAKGKDDAVTGEAVLCAIGRKPYCEGLFADGLQPAMCGKSIQVDERYATSIPGVYAIGDVSSVIQLAHMAAAQGTACVDMLAGVENHTDMSVVPSCIYCHPEIAVVGLTDAEAKAAGIEVKVGKCVMGGNARTLIADPGRSFMKVVARSDNGQIVGAQLMCMGSTDMISQISEAMANHMTAAQLLLAMRPHPTFEEALTDALTDLCSKLAK